MSVDVVRTSGPLKRGGMVDFALLRTLLQILTRSDKLRCNRAMSCFSIIGTRIFEDSLSDYENHKTVTYFQESYSNGTDGNNGCDVQWQRHK